MVGCGLACPGGGGAGVSGCEFRGSGWGYRRCQNSGQGGGGSPGGPIPSGVGGGVQHGTRDHIWTQANPDGSEFL